MEEKICINCKIEKQISNRHELCEKCFIIDYKKRRSLSAKLYKEKNVDILKEKNAEWYINNKEKKNESSRNYYAKIKKMSEKYKDEM